MSRRRNLRGLLDKRGWSVPDLVRASGVSRTTIFRCLRGHQPHWLLLSRMAEALEVRATHLERVIENSKEGATR